MRCVNCKWYNEFYGCCSIGSWVVLGACKHWRNEMTQPFGGDMCEEKSVDTIPPKIEKTLDERRKRYGDFGTHAYAKEAIVSYLIRLPSWSTADATSRQAAMMIVDKLVRAFNGDNKYADNPHDIQGYAKLWEDFLNGRCG